MKKESLLVGGICLVFGLVIGFLVSNSINRNAAVSTTAATDLTSSGSALPPDHPPIGQSGTGGQQSAVPEVMAAIEKAKQQPESFEAQMMAGDLYYQIQRFPDAAKYYENANRLKPQDLESIIKSGNARFDAEEYEQAEAWYKKALLQNPRDVNVRSDLGLTYFLREPREIDQALSEFQKALAIEPDHEMTLQNIVIALRENGDTEAAQKMAERLIKVNPENPALKRDKPAATGIQ
ncbi:MAG: tetratricopeptide repeat protein [Acidobacteriota bacterium]